MPKWMHEKKKASKMSYTSHMPKGGSMSPKGDIGAQRQAECMAAGGSKIKGTKNEGNKIKKHSPKVPGGG